MGSFQVIVIFITTAMTLPEAGKRLSTGTESNYTYTVYTLLLTFLDVACSL